MRAELQLLKAMTDIDDKYLAELETDNRKSVKKTRISKPARWLLVAIIVLCISTAAYAAIQWNPVFMDWFKPTDAIIEQTAAGVQNVDVISQCGDYTLRIEQTIGDENTLYLNLEISLPDGVTWRDVLPEDVWKEYGEYAVLSPMYDFYRGEIAYTEIQGMEREEVRMLQKGKYFGPGTGGIRIEAVNPDSNTMECMIRYSTEELTAEPLSLVVTGFNHGIETLSPDSFPLVISWMPENRGKQYEFEVKDKQGKDCGELRISAFHLFVKLYPYPQAEKYDNAVFDFAKDIVFYMKDGTETNAYVLSDGGGGSLNKNAPNRNYVEYHCHFRSILNLDEVEAIQINDYRFELE